jgi:hypothetical protein
MGIFMKITKGKWRVRNGLMVEIEEDRERCYGHCAIFDRHRLYYDDEGRCYRDKKLNGDESEDYYRTPESLDNFVNWDLVEEEIEVLKRNSNPILTLDLCTE